jgi:hypothetical protein
MKVNRWFGEAYRLHLQFEEQVKQETDKMQAISKVGFHRSTQLCVPEDESLRE